MAPHPRPVALRPMLPADGPALAALFRASIEDLTQEDYGEAQREAWAARADDEAAFMQRLTGALTLVASVDGTVAGFATLEGSDRVGMLYVAPDYARRGIASALLDALKRLASGRGASRLTTDASDTAREFFMMRGFVPKVRNMVPVEGEWLGNTTMDLELQPAGFSERGVSQ